MSTPDPKPTTRAALRERTPNRWIPRPGIRLWLFRTLAALGPIVAFYGLMSHEEIALWLGAGGTILGTPAGALASANVPRD